MSEIKACYPKCRFNSKMAAYAFLTTVGSWGDNFTSEPSVAVPAAALAHLVGGEASDLLFRAVPAQMVSRVSERNFVVVAEFRDFGLKCLNFEIKSSKNDIPNLAKIFKKRRHIAMPGKFPI